jgi:hypothetical protein
MDVNKNKFLVDATQTAYLWHHRKYYGTRKSAILALGKRRSATGRQFSECESAFNLGLEVITDTDNIISRLTSNLRLTKAEAKHIADKITTEVLQSNPEFAPEMVDYAINVLFWMPLIR